METRQSDKKIILVDTTYPEVEEFRSSAKLKAGSYIIGRILHLTKDKSSIKDASEIVAEELQTDWINKNVYPKHEKNIAKQIKSTYLKFKGYLDYPKDRTPSNDWLRNVADFNRQMTANAYDIQTDNRQYQKKLEEKYEVPMTKSDELFYKDNCFGEYRATCSRTVDKKWEKNQIRKHKLMKSEKVKWDNQKENQEKELQNKKRQYSETLIDEQVIGSEEKEEMYHPEITVKMKTEVNSSIKTRSSKLTCKEKSPNEFPEVEIRKGHKSFNENVMRCLVKCLADYKISSNDLLGIVKDVGNIIFLQNWKLPDETNNVEHCSESDDDEVFSSIDRNMLPTRITINNWLEDASFMNLKFVADAFLNKEDSIITVGTDDTTKAAGHKLYNVKADHITIKGPGKKRRVLTTGYSETVGHSGEENAKTYNQKLKYLAVLGETSLDDIKEQIDFWMNDRATDCKTMMDCLNVDPDKILKCTAHIILGADHSCDSVFKKTEQKVGVQKLLKITAGQKAFSSPKSSILTLGLIAIAKLLSPSHAAQSISLYQQYIEYMNANTIPHTGFHGFVSNRFGRIAEIAKEFNQRRDTILNFFNDYINVNSNKLILAVSTYVESEWFLLCSRVYERLGNDFIFPLMDILGIDKAKRVKRTDRSWDGLKQFFTHKLTELKKKRDECNTNDEEDLLYKSVLAEVVDTVERQLAEMQFFTDPQYENEKIKYAPLTNSGCESEFAKLDNRLKIAGGTTSVNTLSMKNIVSTNSLLTEPNFVEMPVEDKKMCWKWGRSSDEVKKVKILQKQFLETIKTNKLLSLEKKKQIKMKQAAKSLMLLEKCKAHGGPVTDINLDLLSELTQEQLIAETGYLRHTIAPDIKQKRRIKEGEKYKMQNLTREELIQNIKNAVHPTDEYGDMKELVIAALKE